MTTVIPRISQGPVVTHQDDHASESSDVFSSTKPLSSLQGTSQSNYVFDLNAMFSVNLQGYNNLDEIVHNITDNYNQQDSVAREKIEKSLPARSTIGVDVQLQREVQSILHKLLSANASLKSCLHENDCELLASYATITNVAPGEYHLRVGERHYSAGFLVSGEMIAETLQPLSFEKQAIQMIQDNQPSNNPNAFVTPTCHDDNPLVRRLRAGDSVGSLALFHGLKSRAMYYVEDIEEESMDDPLQCSYIGTGSSAIVSSAPVCVSDKEVTKIGTNILLFSYDALSALASLSPLVFYRLMHAFALEGMNEVKGQPSTTMNNHMNNKHSNTSEMKENVSPVSAWGWAASPSTILEEPETPQNATSGASTARFHDELNLDKFASYALTVIPYQKKEHGANPLISPTNSMPSTSRFARSAKHNTTIHGRHDLPQEYDSFLCIGEWYCILDFLTKVQNDTILCPTPSSGVPLYITAQPLSAATHIQKWLQDTPEGQQYAEHLDSQLTTSKGKYSSVFGFQEGSKSIFQPMTPMSTTNNMNSNNNNTLDYASKGVPQALVPCLPPILKKQVSTVTLAQPNSLTMTSLFPTHQPSARVTAHIARSAYRFVVALLARRCSIAEGGLRMGFGQMNTSDLIQNELTKQVKDQQQEIEKLKKEILDKEKAAAAIAAEKAQTDAAQAVARAQWFLQESNAADSAKDGQQKSDKELDKEDKRDVEVVKAMLIGKKDAKNDSKTSHSNSNSNKNPKNSKNADGSSNADGNNVDAKDLSNNKPTDANGSFIPLIIVANPDQDDTVSSTNEASSPDNTANQKNGTNTTGAKDEDNHLVVSGKDLYMAIEREMIEEQMKALEKRNAAESGSGASKLTYDEKLELFNPQNVMSVRLEAIRRALVALDTLSNSEECKNDPVLAAQVAKASNELAIEAARLEHGIARLTVRNQKQDCQRLLRIIAAVCGKGLIERKRVTKQLYAMHEAFSKATAAAADAVAMCYQSTLGSLPSDIVQDEELLASNTVVTGNATGNVTDRSSKKKSNVVTSSVSKTPNRRSSVASNASSTGSTTNLIEGTNNTNSTANTTIPMDTSVAQRRKEKIDLLSLTAHALADSIAVAMQGGDMTTPKPDVQTNAFERDINDPEDSPKTDTFVCTIRDAEGRLVRVMTIPKNWDVADPHVDEHENQMRMKMYEDFMTEELPPGHTRVIQSKSDGNPVLPARCLQYWLGPDGVAGDSETAARYALDGNAQEYVELCKTVENPESTKKTPTKKRNTSNTSSKASASSSQLSSARGHGKMKKTKSTNANYHLQNSKEMHDNPAVMNETLGNLFEAQLVLSAAVHVEAVQVSKDLREKTRQLSVLMKKEREKRATLLMEMEHQASNSDMQVALKQEMTQIRKDRDTEVVQKEAMIREMEETKLRSQRNFKEEKEELKKKLKATEEHLRKTRAESDKCRDDEHRIREKLIEYERGRQKERDEYRKMEKKQEHTERDQNVKQSDNEDLERKVASLSRQQFSHGNNPSTENNGLSKDEEENMLRQRVALEEENRALAKRSQHQRKQISDGREQLAVLAAKERDLMAAIDSLRLAHSTMMMNTKNSPPPPHRTNISIPQHRNSRESSAQGGRQGLPAAGSQILYQGGGGARPAPYSHFLPPLQQQ